MKEFLKKHKKLWIILAIVIVAVVAAILIFSKIRNNKAAQMAAAANNFETDQVTRRDLVSSIAANGTIVASDDKNVTANVSGVEFATVDVEEGDVVKEGDLICTFDSTLLEQKLEDAKTTLAADEASASLNLTSAQRMLQEAETTRDLDAESADASIANAWQDYLRALTDVEEAEDKYNDAKETTAEKSGELNRVESEQSDLNKCEVEFAETKNKLIEYMSANNISSVGNIVSSIAIGTEDWCYIDGSTTHFTYTSDDDGSQQVQINKYLTILKEDRAYHADYVSGQSADSDVSTWQSKTDSAENSEEQAKSSYESAIKSAQSLYNTYLDKVRSKKSTDSKSDSSIASQEDSVKKSEIAASTAGLNDKEQIASYEDQLEDYTVLAPISGTVTAVNFDPGDGYSNSATIVTIEDVSSYQVSAEIEEYDIGEIQVGQKVVIKTNGTGDEELEGKVAEIADHATSGSTSSSSTTYNVKIDVLTKNDNLKLDMTAKVSIITDEVTDALTVPYDAVQTDDDGNDFVEVVTSDTTQNMAAAPGADGTDASDDTAVSPKADQNADGSEAPSGDAPADASQDSDSAAAPSEGQMPQGAPAGGKSGGLFGNKNVEMPTVTTKKVYVTRGAESDYYIEVASDELKEGDTVKVVSSDNGNNLQGMMMGMGPMGGF